MMLYLTGANYSLSKSPNNPQQDVNKSLGGYVSSTPVPNSALNVIFDLISEYTEEKKLRETIALGLINKFDREISNVEIKIITEDFNKAEWRIAVVPLDSSYSMEQIANRYQEPILGDFYNVDFRRAYVDFEIRQYASEGEEILFTPFGVQVEVKESGIEGTWKAIEEAFSNNTDYRVIRLSENRIRFEKQDDNVVTDAISCSYVATEGFSGEFEGKLENRVNNTSLISDRILPGQGLGIWIQRNIKNNLQRSNEQILEDYKNKVVRREREEVELVITYDEVEQKNYSEDFNEEEYS